MGPGPVERISWEQFLELPDLPDGRHAAALIDGEVVWMAPPSQPHEDLVFRLMLALRSWIDAGGHGWASTRPLVHIEGRPLGYEADLAWFAPEAVGLDEKGRPMATGDPTIAIEVLSPSNGFTLMVRRTRDYALAGVPELWAFDQRTQTASRLSNIVDGAYTLIEELVGDDVLASPLLPGFSVRVAEIL